MKKILKISLIVIFSGLFVWTLYFLWNKSKDKPVVYETKNAQYKDIIKKTVATGSVVPRKEIEIVPDISGIVEEIYVKAGHNIKKGDLIAKVKVVPNMVQLSSAQSRLEKAQINLKDAERVFKRQQKLFNDKVIAEAEFEEYQIQLDNAKAELKAADDNLQLIREGVSKSSGKVSNTMVKSTITGMVLDVPVEEGNSVIERNNFNPGTTIAVVADMGEMIFKGKVDETEVGKIREGMNLTLTIGAIDDVKFDAELEYISPKGVDENGTIQFEIEAELELVDTVFIRAGYSANAEIILEHKDSVLSVPEGIVEFINDSAFVEIETAEKQVFEKKNIETGISDGINIEVLAGLTTKENIKVPK